MHVLSFEKKHDLGKWFYQKSAHETVEKNIQVDEKIQFTLHRVNPYSGSFSTDPLSCSEEAEKVYDYLLKTRPEFSFMVLLWPERTHTFKEGVLDLLCPLTRRAYLLSPDTPSSEKRIWIIASIIVDVVTFIIRLFTFIPAICIKAAKQDHPLKQELPPDVESVYVCCKKTWSISQKSFTSEFEWRVDFYPALQDTFKDSTGKGWALDANFVIGKRIVVDYSSGARWDFYNKNLEIDGRSTEDFFAEQKVGSKRLYLFQKLGEVFAAPQVTFL